MRARQFLAAVTAFATPMIALAETASRTGVIPTPETLAVRILPEPETLALIAIAGVAAAIARWRNKK